MSTEMVISFLQLATPFVAFLLGVGFTALLGRLPQNVQEAAKIVAAMVVPAIEQVAQDLSNEEKKQQAVERVHGILSALGFRNINDALIDAAIESAVYLLKQK
ncbi:superfamily 6 holin (LLH) [Thermosporothrix hazakensis]|jgi:hypothetical protein|uniref:Superfamily 6 holin (LLH) n=1 Tax=Thermosporothrix hazakensis TaxID=644383 RepID=A0A326U712_THEHA|nr:phage holin, LLH family [Thermosporothrix hazakensis]PZW28411.1 superfamily 6 holin (LLH) [Thermosporothrix hazakensis]GCE45191.1 hypothetical protein KTH_00600 [Thermosporothrix hazakensis]